MTDALTLATIPATAATAERVRRERARRDLVAFSEYVAPWYRPGAHHRKVAEYLHAVAHFIQSGGTNGIGRLMIFEPPRHGKTEQAAQLFPAWLLGRRPEARVIVTSYGADLASRSSRNIRNYVESEKYRAVFGDLSTAETPVDVSADSRSASEWDLAAPHRGGVVAAGIGGGITGKGAHLLIIDDPFKSREDAESESYRQKVLDWYASTAYTRLEDHGAIVLMHTRWHPDDLAGELLKRMTRDPLADQWTVLDLPALAMEPDGYALSEEHQRQEWAAGLYITREDALGRQPGEALWPEKFTAEDFARMAVNIGPYDFAALYQQRPRPQEGAFFGRGDFEVVEAAPEGLNWVRYVDLALSEKKTADFNATVAVALDANGTVYLRDMLRVRGWVEFKAQVKPTMLSETERGTVWGFEDVAFQALALMELQNDRELAGVSMMAVRPEKDKVTRARPLQTRARAGKVKLVNGPWVQKFLAEALDFPAGRHDDQIDTASGGLEMVAGHVLVGQLGF